MLTMLMTITMWTTTINVEGDAVGNCNNDDDDDDVDGHGIVDGYGFFAVGLVCAQCSSVLVRALVTIQSSQSSGQWKTQLL